MKRAGNELLQFLGGLAMLVAGLYILSQKVMVSTSFFGYGMMLGRFSVSNGMIMIPFIIGIVWMFASGGSFASKVFTGFGVLIIVVSLIISTNIRLVHMTLYEWIVILVLIFGGAGLLAKILFMNPKAGRGERGGYGEAGGVGEDRRIADERRKLKEIEKEIEQMKKDR